LIKNIKKIKTSFILGLCFISLFAFVIPQVTAKDPVYNAFVVVDIDWSDELTDEPLVPRGEIVDLELIIILEIKTGPTFGAGVLEGYQTSEALIDLFVVDFPSWCSVTIESDLLMTNISEREEAPTTLFIHVNENAPAYGNGVIKIRVKVDDLGLIKGDDRVFNLTFKPAYFPIIKTNLPETNSKEIDPSSKVVFPIEIENIGNAETKVFFEVFNVPNDWSATVTDNIILGEAKGSKGIAYLTILPSRDLGYHYDEANIIVKITPAFSGDINTTGKPIFAHFIVKNRGFSSSGMEFYIPIAIILIIIIVLLITFYQRKRKKTEDNV
jgi:hypothetical protein